MCHARTKHIDVKYHKIRERLSFGDVSLSKIHTDESAYDMLTKPVVRDKLKHLLDLIHVRSC